MCNCHQPPAHGVSSPAPVPPAFPGEAGLVMLEYIGTRAAASYGPVTGARYPFDERARQYVDKRDAEKLKAQAVDGWLQFREVR